ncbi:MAG: formimidoylglutamate deiminase [Hyphomicrobiaceae bacterium]
MSKLFFERALLAEGWAGDVRIDVDAEGRIASVAKGASPGGADHRGAIGLPGLANLHSHAFQRGMAGLAETAGPTKDSFWTWRQVMYRFLDRLTPEDVEAIAGGLYVEMLEAGFTSVGEFHYLHHAPDGGWYDDPAEMAGRIAAASKATGLGLTLLPVFYAQGGFGGQPVQAQQRRFASTAETFAKLREGAARHIAGLPHARVGIAPHSLRAVTPESLAQVTSAFGDGPIHIHVAEQTKEVEDCRAWSGTTPVAWLLDHADVDRRWCLVHATHMTNVETEAMARSGAVAGLCPQTEANLGDGIFDGVTYLAAQGRYGVGTDSHIRVDAAEEIRTLEYSQRLRDRARNVLTREGASTGRTLYATACHDGAAAIGRPAGTLAAGQIADIVSLDADHPLLAGRQDDTALDSWLFSGDGRQVRDVWVAGAHVVAEGRHRQRDVLRSRLAATLRRLAE